MNIGKCPKCEKTVTSVTIEAVDIKQGFRSAFLGVSYCCQWCKTVLSVSVDPLALKADIVRELTEAVNGGAR